MLWIIKNTTPMKEKEVPNNSINEKLQRVVFIDADSKTYQLNEISFNERFVYAYKAFHVLYEPLVSIINKSDGHVIINLKKDSDVLFSFENITAAIKEQSESVGYYL